MRILHFEDEWPKTRSIAHRLHDLVFARLPRERAVELDLKEVEHLKTSSPSRITVALNEKPRKLVFDYIFVTELDALKDMAKDDDAVVVDIMRSNQKGRFVSMLDEILPLMRQSGFNKDNWRYFSAYPEKVPADCELEGFTKRQDSELVEFLFKKVWERWSRS